MTDLTPSEFLRTMTKGRKSGRMGSRGSRALQETLPLVLLSADCRFNKRETFLRDAPLYLEIGFGSGSFLYDNARRHPECDFVGIEIYRPGIAKLLQNLTDGQNPRNLIVNNVRIFNDDARIVLSQSIPADLFEGIYILFPDPWHKTRHYKRRLINADFARTLLPLIKGNGFVEVATDHTDYSIEIKKAFYEAGFSEDPGHMSTLYTTTYALKAGTKKNTVQAFRFVKER